MRDHILLYINGVRHRLKGAEVLLPLSDFLRKKLYLTGTKVVCAEGDCGACTVLRAFPHSTGCFHFQSINACIIPVFLLDGSHIITIEGLQVDNELTPVQEAMLQNYGAQCGFCTPGMVMSLTELAEEKERPTAQQVKNALTGNLCRCTGYQGIIDAGLHMDSLKSREVMERYYDPAIIDELKIDIQTPFMLQGERWQVWAPTTYHEATQIKANDPEIRLVSSATDLGVLINKEKMKWSKVMTLHLIPEAYEIKEEIKTLVVGAKVSLSTVQSVTKKCALEFSSLLNVFASPQIKNMGTLVGNVANGSPIGDTLPFLLVSQAVVELISIRGTRRVNLNDFYLGYRKMDLGDDEIIKKIYIPLPDEHSVVKIYKVSKRKDLDISTVSSAFWYSGDGQGKIAQIRFAMGGVSATPIRMKKTEEYLKGKCWDQNTIRMALQIIRQEIHPLSDVRGSDEFRYQLAENLFRKFCYDLQVIQGSVK